LFGFTIASIATGFSQENITAKWHKDEYKNLDGIPHLDYLYDAKEKVFL
ncbi:MAG: hypothetical protein HC831_23360, partial [Chloroflexia bacterium]|nr:hypothetical protein [Chloroflexia bacterium]